MSRVTLATLISGNNSVKCQYRMIAGGATNMHFATRFLVAVKYANK
jgi:hypothetical protein